MDIYEQMEEKDLMIQEVIVVEGKSDVEAVKKAVDCECVITHGHGFSDELLDRLADLQRRRGIIVFTDPDYAGKKIRRRIREAVPEAKHAYLDRRHASLSGDVGVENADPESIRRALWKAHAGLAERRREFSHQDLLDFGLEGDTGAKEKRIALSRELGIGYGNAKQLLARLNDYDISREEFTKAMERISGEADDSGK